MNTLFGNVMTSGETVIANNPEIDSRAGGIPDGHPPLDAFLGLPFFHRENIIGMVGIANRKNGYDDEFVENLKPFLSTYGNILLSVRSQAAQKAVESSLRESEARGGEDFWLWPGRAAGDGCQQTHAGTSRPKSQGIC